MIEYIDFGDRQKWTREEVSIFLDIHASLKSTTVKNTIEWLQWEDHTERIYDKFEEIPHVHFCSMLGPYCVACHCTLPGPNGQWE